MAKKYKQESLFDFDSNSDFIETTVQDHVRSHNKAKTTSPDIITPTIEETNVLMSKADTHTKQSENIITDVGEKIGGARKDFATKGLSIDDFSKMNSVEREKNVKRDNIWRALKASDAIEQGCNPYVYLYADNIRKTISPTPYQKGKQPPSPESVTAYIEFVTFAKESIEKALYAETLGEAQDFFKAQMLQVYFEKIKERNGRTAYVLTKEGEEIERYTQFGRYDEKRKMFDLIFNPHIFNHHGTFNKEWDEIIHGNKRGLNNEKLKNSDLKHLIKQSYYLGSIERVGGENYRLNATTKLTAEDFMDTFGFRAVEFGNWMKQGKNINERQEVLNHAYDAFKDLAKVLGIPDKAIGMDGRLAIAFGSRGKGGKNAASAHYEYERMVINMTKLNGAGSLAHEWFHFQDNLFGTRMYGRNQDRSTRMASEAYKLGDERESFKKLENDQPKLFDAIRSFEMTKLSLLYNGARSYLSNELYDTLYYHIDRGKYFYDKSKKGNERSRAHYRLRTQETLDEIGGRTEFYTSGISYDKGRKAYWSKPLELMARAFETYIIDKLDELGMKNDYLVSHSKGNEGMTKHLEYISNGEKQVGVSNVYPASKERVLAKQYFDTLMENIKMSGLFKIPPPNEEKSIIKEITIGDEKVSLVRDNSKLENTMRYDAIHESIKTGETHSLSPLQDTMERIDLLYHKEIEAMNERAQKNKQNQNKMKLK